MNKEQIIKDFELLKSLYNGNHIAKEDFNRLQDVLHGLNGSFNSRLK